MIARGVNWVRVVKYVWVTASLSVWLFGLGSCATEPSFFAQNIVFPLVILLSFPAGLLFLLFVGPFIDIYPSIGHSNGGSQMLTEKRRNLPGVNSLPRHIAQ